LFRTLCYETIVTRSDWRLVLLGPLLVAAAACESVEPFSLVGGELDAGMDAALMAAAAVDPDGAPDAAPVDAGPDGEVRCGGEVCSGESPLEGFDVAPCCADERGCGVRIVGIPAVDDDLCITWTDDARRNRDCPPLAEGIEYGCCLDDGRCGFFFDDPGGRPWCVDPTAAGLPPGPDCDPANVCRQDDGSCSGG
jgi:hypothetical protein